MDSQRSYWDKTDSASLEVGGGGRVRLELVFFLCNVSHETILYRFLAGVNLCFLASERRVEWFMFFLSLWLSKSISINFVPKRMFIRKIRRFNVDEIDTCTAYCTKLSINSFNQTHGNNATCVFKVYFKHHKSPFFIGK